MKKVDIKDISPNQLLAIKFLLTYDDMEEYLIDDSSIYVPRYFFAKGIPFRNITKLYQGRYIQQVSIKYPPRPHQVRAIDALLKNQKGILNLACGKGKTYCALNLIAHTKLPTAVIVDKANLLYQWENAISEHINEKLNVGLVKGNKWQYKNKDIVLISINTLVSRIKKDRVPKDFFNTFGLVIFDECHHLAANSLRKVIPHFPYKRLGLSATPKREDGNEEIFFNHLGPIIYSDLTQDLIPTIKFMVLPTAAELPMTVRDTTGEINHRRLCAYLGSINERNKFVLKQINHLLSLDHKILCLTHSVDHANNFANEFGFSCVTGAVNPKDRKNIIENSPVTIATIDIAAEALDVPELSGLIILTPFGGRIGNTLFQVLGRIQRKKKSKVHPIAIFLEDCNIGMCKSLMHQIRKRLADAKYSYIRDEVMY